MKFNRILQSPLAQKSAKQYVLVIYDISKTKRRNKFVKLLNSFGGRVQKSAFEFLISSSQYRDLTRRIDNFYNIEENDQIRIYKFRGEADLICYGDELLVSEPELGLEFI